MNDLNAAELNFLEIMARDARHDDVNTARAAREAQVEFDIAREIARRFQSYWLAA